MIMEESEMKRYNVRFSLPRAAAVAMLACVLLVGTLSAAYAASGEFRQAVKVWMYGAETEAMLSREEGDDYFTLTWTDENGERHERGGGGIAMEADGTERPITAEEYLEQLTGNADVENTEDGRLMLYYYDQALDITDAFDADGNCKLALEHDGKTTYILVRGNADEDWALWQSDEGFDALMQDMRDSLDAEAAEDEETDAATTFELPDGGAAGE